MDVKKFATDTGTEVVRSLLQMIGYEPDQFRELPDFIEHATGLIMPALTTATTPAQSRITELERQLAAAQREQEETLTYVSGCLGIIKDRKSDVLGIAITDLAYERDSLREQLEEAKNDSDGAKKRLSEELGVQIKANANLAAERDQLRADLTEVTKERDAAIHEREACHAIWDRILALCGYDKGQSYPGVEGAVKKVVDTLAAVTGERDELKGAISERRMCVMRRDTGAFLAFVPDIESAHQQRVATLEADLAIALERIREMNEALTVWKRSDELSEAAEMHSEDAEAAGYSNDPTGAISVSESYVRAQNEYNRALELRDAALSAQRESETTGKGGA